MYVGQISVCGYVGVGVGYVGGWMYVGRIGVCGCVDVGVGCVGGWMYVGGMGVCGYVWVVCMGGLCGCVELRLNLAITNNISEHKTYKPTRSSKV